MRRNCLVKVAAGRLGRKIHLIVRGKSGRSEGEMVAYNSLLSSRWIISVMRPEDYDAFLVYSTCIFTCLTYAEYQRTFKYLQRFDGTMAFFIGTDMVRWLIILIRTDVPYCIVTARLQPPFLKLFSFWCLHDESWWIMTIMMSSDDFMDAKKYVRYVSYFSLISDANFRERIWKFWKWCAFYRCAQNVVKIMEVYV